MAMTTGGGSGGRKAMSEINVTPLVDVMLVLLVIFMISTPLIVKDESERLLDMNLPVTEDNPTTVDISAEDKLILSIGPNLRVMVGDELITDCSHALAVPGRGTVEYAAAFASAAEPCFIEIGEKLGNNPRLRDDESLYLLADTSVPYGFVVGAMNRIRLAGVTNVGMVTNPEYLDSSSSSGAAP